MRKSSKFQFCIFFFNFVLNLSLKECLSCWFKFWSWKCFCSLFCFDISWWVLGEFNYWIIKWWFLLWFLYWFFQFSKSKYKNAEIWNIYQNLVYRHVERNLLDIIIQAELFLCYFSSTDAMRKKLLALIW